MTRHEVQTSIGDQRGISLLEMMIALSVIMIGLLGMFGLSLTLANSTGVSENMTLATSLAQDRMEQIKSGAYDEIISDNYPAEDFNTIAGHADFKRNVTVSINSPSTGMKTILVNVNWRADYDGTEKGVTLQTILVDY